MKTIQYLYLLACCFVVCEASDTNSASTNAIAAHQRFYANYKAHRARLERGVQDLERVKSQQALVDRKKVEAGITTADSPIVQYGNRIAALKKDLAKLDVARLEYERRFPEAIRYANNVAPVVAAPEPPQRQPAQRVIIQRDPNERILTPAQQVGAAVR